MLHAIVRIYPHQTFRRFRDNRFGSNKCCDTLTIDKDGWPVAIGRSKEIGKECIGKKGKMAGRDFASESKAFQCFQTTNVGNHPFPNVLDNI
jgi:hypothetical protein